MSLMGSVSDMESNQKVSRPDPGPVPESCEAVAEPDLLWVALPPGSPCRTKGPWGAHCPHSAIAAFRHGDACCGKHSHGHWVEDGQVMHWVWRHLP